MLVLRSSRILRIILFAALWLGCPGSERDQEIDPVPVWPASDLVAVAVIDADHLIVVAVTGEIYHTSDSGRSWQRGDVPALAGLRGISMADRQTGWVVGDGVILRTDEGGSSWRQQRFPERAGRPGLVSVSAIDSLHAIAIGEAGERLRTEDGGLTWRDVSPDSVDPSGRPIVMSDVFCDRAARGRCWLVGQAIRRTMDAGRTWQHVEVEDIARVDPIVFRPGGVEVETFEAERFERFLEANRHRTYSNWQIEPGVGPRELEEVGRRRDPELLFELIEGRLQEVRSMIEEAGISSDRVLTSGAPPWDYEDYLDDDPDFLDRYWTARSAASPSVRVRIADAPTFHSLRVRDRDFGLAVGAKGAVLRSENAGENWMMTERLSVHDLLAVGIGQRCVVAVGRQGGLWLSEDEGLSWRRPTREGIAPFFDALRAVSFSPDGEFGIIVGDRGRMLRSVDGGVNWALLTSGGQ